LAVEEAIGGEACNRGHGAGKPIPQQTNDGDVGQLGADEFARYWEDQTRLNPILHQPLLHRGYAGDLLQGWYTGQQPRWTLP
jgi:hypothetical protein